MEVPPVRDSIPNSQFIDKEVVMLQTLQMILKKFGKTPLTCSQNKNHSISHLMAIREIVPINPLLQEVYLPSNMIQEPKTWVKHLVM
jgi:hypothetical protein